MKKEALFVAFLIASFCSSPGAVEKSVFGPERFDVVERHGKDNRYTRTFQSTEALYLIKLKNGDKIFERSELIELTVNGEKILKEDLYEFTVAACFVTLKKENTLEVAIKDNAPSGMKRPVLPPRFITIEIDEAGKNMPAGVFGLQSWESLNELVAVIDKIKSRTSRELAIAGESLSNDLSVRTAALRKLGDARDSDSREFIRLVYGNYLHKSEVRAEAAIALGLLGDASSIPALIQGVLDSDEQLRISSARALSFFREEDTQKPFADAVMRLDNIRKDAVVRAVSEAGWKPVSTLLTLAESNDRSASLLAIEILGKTGDKRAADFLLRLFEKGHSGVIISALGDTGDMRALEPLLSLANDPAKRKGVEIELGSALAALGDQRAAVPIGEMIRSASSRWMFQKLNEAYKILTGKDFFSKNGEQ